MSDGRSRISTDLDFGRDGKQVGYLNVPHSRDSSAWGTLLIPITVIRNGDGPTVLFTGANHGDEYEGPIALSKLARALEPDRIDGRVIILPALNLPAFKAARRLSPIDGKNMNRSFPGSRNGTMTEVIAHYVYTELLPLADVVVDLHSGGKSMTLLPCAVMHRLSDKAFEARTMEALQAFGAPAGLVLEELDSEGMLDTAVEEMGKVFLSTELGGGGTLSVQTVAVADRGVRNILSHFGVLEDAPAPSVEPTRLMEVPDTDCYVAAGHDGLFEPLFEVGDSVAAGQPVGRLHFIEDPHRQPVDLPARRAGTLICRRVPGETERGDCVAVIAQDL